MLQPAHPRRPLGVLPPQEGEHHQEQKEHDDQPVDHGPDRALPARAGGPPELAGYPVGGYGPGGDGQGRAGKEGQVRVNHPDWGDSCRQGSSSLTPSGATTAPVGRHTTRPTAPGPQDRAECGGRRPRHLQDRAGTSSRTSTAAHSSSPSQDPEQAGVIDAHLTICQPPWRCAGTAKGCGLRPLCGRARRHGNAQPTCERAGQADLGLVGFGPQHTSSLIG